MQIEQALVNLNIFPDSVQRVPALRAFWDLEKTVLHEIRVTVLWSLTNTNSPTYTYIIKKRVSGNRVSDFRVSGGAPVPAFSVHDWIQIYWFHLQTIQLSRHRLGNSTMSDLLHTTRWMQQLQ